MGVLSDTIIRGLCVGEQKMLDPFVDYGGCPKGVISFGLTSAGYDLRLADELLGFRNHGDDGERIDPKLFGESKYRTTMLREITADYVRGEAVFVLPPHSYVLGRSHEHIKLPRNIKGRCVGKSTLARSGILINTTPLEPEWEGYLTIEIGNVTPSPAVVYVMQGIAQLEFEYISGVVEQSYADKKGKYQNQIGVQPAKVE